MMPTIFVDAIPTKSFLRERGLNSLGGAKGLVENDNLSGGNALGPGRKCFLGMGDGPEGNFSFWSYFRCRLMC